MITLSGLEPKHYSITPEGLNELEGQLEELKHKRKEVAAQLYEITSQSTELGAREDSTFALHQNQATELDGQIDLLERIIGMVTIIERPSTFDAVQLGSRVCIKLDGKEHCYRLVGALEADPLEDKISNESPLGQSLMGRKVNETFDVASPTGQHMTATVIRIHE
jgi:transcription elongation factor GreA